MSGTGIAVAAVALAVTPQASASPPFAVQNPAGSGGFSVTTKATIDLPGKGGHGDVVVADPAAHSVYVAQSPDDDVVILDTDTNTIRSVVKGVAEANGIAYSPQYVFVAAAKSNELAVISKDTWRVVAMVRSGGAAPDAVYYDAGKNSVFVGNIDSNNVVEFSAKAPFAVKGTLDLPAKGANGEDLGTYVPTTDRIYQSLDNRIVVINARTRTIERVFTLPLPATESSKAIFYDRPQDVLWVGTTASEVLGVNPSTGAVAATVKTTSGMDQVTGDARRQLLFLGEKKGVMGVVNLSTKRNVTDVPTEPVFHTLAYLPETGNVYAYLNTSNKVVVYHVVPKTPLGAATAVDGSTAAGAQNKPLVYGGAAALAAVAALAFGLIARRRRSLPSEHHAG